MRFDPNNKSGLIIKKGTRFKLANGAYKFYHEDTTVSFDSLTPGKDYYVFCDNSGNITCDLSSTPSSNQVKIGRFHTLCVDVGTINMIIPTDQTTTGGTLMVKPYTDEDADFKAFYEKTITAINTGSPYNIATVEHPLSGYLSGEILPESVFCLDFHPNTLYEDAMVYDKATDKVIDIYLQSGTGQNTRSSYGAVHTVSRQQPNHIGDMIAVGKELLDDTEFYSASIGSNQATNISGSTDASTVGGHSDTANRRMISAIGCEEMCGYLWQWLRDFTTVITTSDWTVTDGRGSFGKEYWTPHAVLAGGDWSNGS